MAHLDWSTFNKQLMRAVYGNRSINPALYSAGNYKGYHIGRIFYNGSWYYGCASGPYFPCAYDDVATLKHVIDRHLGPANSRDEIVRYF